MLVTCTAPAHSELVDLLHGIGSAIDVSNFCHAFLIMSLFSSSFGSMK